jgi:hypothetical protein
MATRPKPNWKVLDPLLPVLEHEGWSLAQIAEDWGMSLATLEEHLTQEGAIVKKTDVDWERFDELKGQGLPMTRISEAMGIPRTTLGPLAKARDKAHHSTLAEHHDTPKAHPSTPGAPELLEVHPGTPEPTKSVLDEQDTQEHPRTLPDPGHTEVRPGTLEGHQEVMEDVYQSVPDVPHISTGAESSAEQSADTEADALFGEHNGQSVDVHRPVQSPVQTFDPGVDDSAESSAEMGIDDHANHLPVQRPVHQLDTGAVHDSVQIPVQRFERLEGEVQALAHVVRSLMDRMNDRPVHAPVQITTTPPYPKGKSVRWNLWILEPIRDELATMAAEREMSPSQLVQELLWKALRQE